MTALLLSAIVALVGFLTLIRNAAKKLERDIRDAAQTERTPTWDMHSPQSGSYSSEASPHHCPNCAATHAHDRKKHTNYRRPYRQ